MAPRRFSLTGIRPRVKLNSELIFGGALALLVDAPFVFFGAGYMSGRTVLLGTPWEEIRVGGEKIAVIAGDRTSIKPLTTEARRHGGTEESGVVD